ncbi:hypothetical protein HKCCE2091_13030 [Rhodobacterales bacterium HKCCE2091]|nr:hypothetical protein [Rhodobacterales bacterium HKCCE2091]
MARKDQSQEVYTLLVTVGRRDGDGLPDGWDGAALLCFASGRGEDEAVRETIAVLKTADLAPLEVESYGTLDERIAQGHEIGGEERALMDRALTDNAVIVAQTMPLEAGD